MKSSVLRYWTKIGALAGPALLIGEMLLRGRAFGWGAPAFQFLPWHIYAFKSLQNGVLPLWNPLNGLGTPLLANYQTALFYPPNWIVLLLAAVGGESWLVWGHTLLIMLHLSFAGWGMVRLLERLGIGTTGQLLGGLVYPLSGYLVARLGFFPMIWTASWMPWVLLAASQIALPLREEITPSPKIPPALILCLALMLLAGHAQLSWYILLFTAGWVFTGGWLNRGLKQALLSVGRLGAAGLLAVCLALVQLAPTAEYLLQSQRSAQVDFETAISYSFWPWRLLSLIAPDLFGNPGLGNYWGYASFWEDAIYIGVLPFLLALTSIKCLWSVRKKQGDDASKNGLVLFLWFMSLLSILLALGKNTPVFPFLYRNVPSFAMFNAPARYLLWLEFALILLAAIVTDAWRAPTGKGIYWLRLATAGGAAVTLGAFASFLSLGDVSPTFVPAAAMAGVWALGSGLLLLFKPTAGHYQKEKLWQVALLILVGLDLFAAGRLLNPSVEASFYKTGAVSPWLQEAGFDGGRVYMSLADDYRIKYRRFLRFGDYTPIEDPIHLRWAMPANINLLSGVPSANLFDPLQPGRYAQWMQHLESLTEGQRSAWLAEMDVTMVERVSVNSTKGVEFDSIKGSGRVRWYVCAQAAANAEESWAQLNRQLNQANEGSAARKVILEANVPSGSPGCDEAAGSEIDVLDERPDQMKFAVNSSADGWLFVADLWYPGWRAWVDGIRVPVVRANYLFRAIPVKAGSHEVILAYRPVSFYAGLAIGVLGWGIFFVYKIKSHIIKIHPSLNGVSFRWINLQR